MSKLKKNILRDLVYTQLKTMLLDKALVPGQKISKKEIADLLGVSQTPVQESIIKLIQEGLFEEQQGGVFVKVFTDQDMRDFFAVRAGIEGIALRLCITQKGPSCLHDVLCLFDDFSLPIDDPETKALYQKTDRHFHEEILRRSGNKIIQNFVEDFSFILRCYHKGLLREPNETLEEHRAIIEATRAGDAQEAQNLLMKHHLTSYDRISEDHLSFAPIEVENLPSEN